MFLCSWSKLVGFTKAKVRSLLTLSVLPAVALGPLRTEAILIHAHHGRDIHLHAVSPIDSKGQLENWHCEHQTDRPVAGSPHEDCNTVVLMLGLPDAVVRQRGMSADTTSSTGPAFALRSMAAAVDEGLCKDLSRYEHSWTRAPNLRAERIVTNILLSNHALLL